MTQYQANITKQADLFYAMIVRVDSDGEKSVVSDYQARFFKTLKAAQKSTAAYINKQ